MLTSLTSAVGLEVGLLGVIPVNPFISQYGNY